MCLYVQIKNNNYRNAYKYTILGVSKYVYNNILRLWLYEKIDNIMYTLIRVAHKKSMFIRSPSTKIFYVKWMILTNFEFKISIITCASQHLNF